VSDPTRRRRVVLLLAGIGIVLVAGASGLLVARSLGATGRPHAGGRVVATSATPAATADAGGAPAVSPSPGAGAWWSPLPTDTASFVPSRLVVERLRVQAPIEVKGVDAQNQMQAPDRPEDAAWYRFSARPGSGSNAVFSGHRDFAKVGPAIFWHLDQLVAGDAIDVVSDHRTEIRYRVARVTSYRVTAMPMAQLLAADRGDEITIITCAGRYTPSAGYDSRLVVRAVRD
jgi:hypothetical protein